MDRRSLTDLAKELRDQLTLLVRLELRLARAELEAQAEQAARGAAFIAAAALLALASLTLLLAAATVSLQVVVSARGLAPWPSLLVALLVVTVVVALAAGALYLRGRALLPRRPLRPDVTLDSLRDSTQPLRPNDGSD